MEKKTMDTLRTMLCGELEDIAKKGLNSHEDLDMLKDLLDSAKNLEKIDKYKREKEQAEYGEMDRGYSQRKYYIDADYDPYGPMQSYARGGQGMNGGNSYGYSMGRVYDGGSYANGNSYLTRGNSYGYREPMWNEPMYSMARGYSMTGSKEEMIGELNQMMNEAADEKTKMAIQKAITEMNN